MVLNGFRGCYKSLNGVRGCYMVLQAVTGCYMVLDGVIHVVRGSYRMLHCVTKKISPFCLVLGCARFLSKGPK